MHGGGGYKEISEEINKFVKKQITKLDGISQEFKQKGMEFPEYSQELVFKVKTSQKVNEEDFRTQLKRAGCETIVSTMGKRAEWIISSKDPNLKRLKEKISQRIEKTKPNFIDGISEFIEIQFQDKLGENIKEKPLGTIEKARLVLSLNKKESDVSEEKLNSALQLITNLAAENDLKIYDKLITDNICLILLDGTLNFAKKIANIDIVEKIDRPPRFLLEKIVDKLISDIGESNPPNEKDHGILVMDSGIILHPLLENAVDQNNGVVGLPDRNQNDDRRHGTMVSGIALHEDIEQGIIEKKFNSNVWIYSAKVFYESNGEIVETDEKLIETRIKENLEEIKQKFPKCRVVNLSFGINNRIMYEGQRQFDLAVLIDDLAIKHKDTVFIISSGNIDHQYTINNSYPDYLLSNDLYVKINDPATSIHALSVGATQRFGQLIDQPSNLTKVGPGLNGMIKPDLIDSGGGFNEEIIVLNPNFQQRLFTFSKGTSFSAPKIANFIARLFNQFPNSHRNLVMALLISSTNFPIIIPDAFPKIDSKTTSIDWLKLMSVYGFGKPHFNDAIFSSDDRVVFKHEGKIKMNQVQYFTIKIPDDFVKEKGKRDISISLVYDPPIRRNRADYFGIRMEFHLFKNKPLEEIMDKYNSLDLSESENETEKVPEELTKFEIKLNPGTTLRKKSNHQKGIRTLASSAKLENQHPLVLVILSQKKWDFDENFEQDFAIALTLKHEKSIDLYNQLRIRNQVQTKVRV